MAVVRIPVEVQSPYLPSPALNIFHARVDTTGDIPGWGVQPFNGPMGALHRFYTSVAARYPMDCTIVFPTEVVDVTTQEIHGGYDPLPNVASSGTNWGPPGLAITVSWRTSVAARRGRGRTFLGPIAGAAIDTHGSMVDATRGSVQAAVNTLIGESTAANGWALGVWGQQTAGVADVNVLRDFVSGTVQDKFAHLRSRRD